MNNEALNWAGKLSIGEAALACRYALCELNGFPSWYPRLFAEHGEVISQIILHEIEFELSIEKAEEETHYILSDISWSGEWAWNRLGRALYALLENREPINSSNLNKLLKVVQGADVSDDDLAKLAEKKCKAEPKLPNAASWFAVWVGVKPDKAIPVLTNHIESLPIDDQTTFAMSFVTRLSGGRRSEAAGARSEFHTPKHLKALYLLMHKYIREQEDIDRSKGGVYSPGLRDDAQEARNGLLQILNKLQGKDAFLAMQEISEAHPEQSSRSWLSSLTRRKAEQEADFAPWSPVQVRDFNDKLDRTPATHRDLADLAVLRLLDLKDDLENGDSSVADILRTVDEETKMRNYLGHELREKAFGRYVIPQEEELADAKRPDLRFHGLGFDAPVPAELKLADNWTGPKLFERIENQLAGDYLRDIRSGRGIFALVYRGDKAGWEAPASANRVDFEGLVRSLQDYWSSISAKFSGVDDITVIGIDLTKRSS